MSRLKQQYFRYTLSLLLPLCLMNSVGQDQLKQQKAVRKVGVQMGRWQQHKHPLKKKSEHPCSPSMRNQIQKSMVTIPINLADSSALVALYNSTAGASWFDNTNWLTTASLGTWEGVTVSGGRVTELYLDANNLDGTIPASMGSLTALVDICLECNELDGNIPSELGLCTALEFLCLEDNYLTGSIPSELSACTLLKLLYLDDNFLTGSIPTSLGSLNNLLGLYLDLNLLDGGIPTSFSGLTNLIELYLADNTLTGSIPNAIGTLSQLFTLDLHNNDLSGSIPTALGSLSTLLFLDLSDNGFTGGIPTELGGLSQLLYLDLSINQLNGGIPSILGSLSNLEELDVGENQLTGSIPGALGSLAALEVLGVHENLLNGDIPTELGSLSSLMAMNLSLNGLTGNIPASFASLSALGFVYMDGNALSGNIPTAIGGMGLGPGISDFRYNALYTDNDALRTKLNGWQGGGDWESTQTITPTNPATGAKNSASVTVTWNAITYTGDTGGYRVSYGTASGGPYTYFGMTANKSATSLSVTSLNPSTPYYFVVSAQTNTHANNNNTLVSATSGEVTETTDASLPVELHSLSATITNDDVEVRWTTESETDNLGFVLERAIRESPLRWDVVASYKTHTDLQGHGNSSERHEYAFIDSDVETGQSYTYRLSDVNTSGEVHVYDVIEITLPEAPVETVLEPPYPNPFNPQTKITYQLSDSGPVEIIVYDLLGRKVRTLVNEEQSPGSYNVYWHGNDASGRGTATGTYLIVLKTAEGIKTQKVVMLR
ncbi:T9SS type A sorting domain-containing protein [bacterium]|nr:T9SS type A sorting domain-containing protein [bacterium]